MRIDAHHHLWDLNAVHYPWLMAPGTPRFFGDPTPIQRDYLLSEFRQDAQAHGFDGSVHIQVGAEDPLVEANWVQSVADTNSEWPLVQVAFCDLTAKDLHSSLDQLQALPTLRGLRQIVGRAPDEDATTGTNALLEDPRFLSGLQELAVRGLSFDLQLLPELMEKTAAVLQKSPNTKVAICHAGSPHNRSADGLSQWAEALRHLSELPNVYCKLSGLGMFDHSWTADSVAPIVAEVLSQFGAQRCMFGSNFPVDSLSSDYQTLVSRLQSRIPETDRTAVFGKTAQEFYHI